MVLDVPAEEPAQPSHTQAVLPWRGSHRGVGDPLHSLDEVVGRQLSLPLPLTDFNGVRQELVLPTQIINIPPTARRGADGYGIPSVGATWSEVRWTQIFLKPCFWGLLQISEELQPPGEC